MAVLGVILWIALDVVLVRGLVLAYNDQNRVALGFIIFFMCFRAFVLGCIFTDNWNTTYMDNLPIVTQPDTLIVTGYVLEVDTVKVGE